jgi:hypothetical protein
MLDSFGKDHHVCYQQICNYLKAEAIRRLVIDPKDFKPPVYVKGRRKLRSIFQNKMTKYQAYTKEQERNWRRSWI